MTLRQSCHHKSSQHLISGTAVICPQCFHQPGTFVMYLCILLDCIALCCAICHYIVMSCQGDIKVNYLANSGTLEWKLKGGLMCTVLGSKSLQHIFCQCNMLVSVIDARKLIPLDRARLALPLVPILYTKLSYPSPAWSCGIKLLIYLSSRKTKSTCVPGSKRFMMQVLLAPIWAIASSRPHLAHSYCPKWNTNTPFPHTLHLSSPSPTDISGLPWWLIEPAWGRGDYVISSLSFCLSSQLFIRLSKASRLASLLNQPPFCPLSFLYIGFIHFPWWKESRAAWLSVAVWNSVFLS